MKSQIYIFRFLKTFFVFILLLFTFVNVNSQHQIRHYDLECGLPPAGYDFGRSIINRIDKGYAIAGYSYQSPPCIGSYEWMFLKLNPDGLVSCAKLLGIGQDDKSYSLIQSPSDSGYVLAGYTTNPSPPYRRKATMMKLNRNCDLLYSRAINDSLNSLYYQVIRDPANIWAFTGYIETHITIGYKRNKILASQYFPTGGLSWASRYRIPGISREEAHSICYQPVAGPCYGIAAKTNFFNLPGSPSVNDIMIVKLNYVGAVLWNIVYPLVSSTRPSNTEPRKIIAMPDGGFVVVGFTNAYGSTQRDIIVLRVSAAGVLLWSDTYGSSGYVEEGESIVLDGPNLVITGSRRAASPAGPPDAFILKIPVGGGAPLWTRIWDDSNPTEVGFDIINSMTGTTVPGYAVTGHFSRPVVLTDPFLWRVNSAGIVTGTDCNDSINMPFRHNAHNPHSINLIRDSLNHVNRVCTQVNPPVTVTTPCLGTPASPFEGMNEKEDKDINEYSLKQNSPNPFNPTTTINFELPISGFTKMKVYDLAGREVSTLVNEFKEQGRHVVTFDGTNLASGVYYYKIESEGFTDIKKMILIK